MRRKGITLYEIFVIVGSFLVLAILLFPFFWIFLTSLQDEKHIFSGSLSFGGFTLENYTGLLEIGFSRFFLNSVSISLITVCLVIVVSSLAAYAFSRMDFSGKNWFFLTITGSQLFPWVVLTIPVYIIFWKLHLINSYIGLIIVYISITLPYAILLLISYFSSIPRELDEAAKIDGCSTTRIIFQIIIPTALPGLIATAVYCFIQIWNEYVFALVLVTRTELKTLPLALGMFFGEYTTEWGKVMAASAITSLPTVIFFLLVNKYLVAGLTAGAVKE